MTGSSRLMGSYRDLPGQLLFRNLFQKKRQLRLVPGLSYDAG